MTQLRIQNLHVSIGDKEILKGIDLQVNTGEIHALMGPNGNGKSTLMAAIMGHPNYKVTEGSITFDGVDVLEMPVDERSKAGLFLAMQNPQDIPGVTNSDFLRAAVNAHRETPVSLFEFIKQMEAAIKQMDLKSDLAHRFINEGFSGGEKKRNEIVQLSLLKPKLAMLDEIDSGLDVDALNLVAKVIEDLQKQQELGLLVISHYGRFYELIHPTHAHVLMDGRIVKSGGQELIDKIDSQGYEWLAKEINFDLHKDERPEVISLGSCAVARKGNDNEKDGND